MKYAFIERHRHAWPITVQCRVLEVNVAGYHAHRVRRASDAQRRHLSDEALFGSLKVKRLHGQRFVTRRDAEDEVIAWLLWYNQARRHSTLAYLSPMQFEQTWLAAQPRRATS